MDFQITARYGRKRQRYHTFEVNAETAVKALRIAADQIPEEIAATVDLVELRSTRRPGS
jgi:hypothetical protein